MDKTCNKIKRVPIYAYLILAILVVGGYFLNIIKFSVDVPNADDFNVYMEFLNTYLNTRNFHEKVALFFKPHNEHYLVIPRLLALSLLYFTGHINFIWLNIIGSAALLVFPLFVLFSSDIQNENRHLLFLCICLMIFHPQYAEATLWATAAISNLWVIGLALFSLIFSNKHGARYALLSFIFGLLAAGTLGNGVLVFIILGILFFLRRQYLKGGLYIVVFATLIYLMQGHAEKLPASRSAQELLHFALNIIDYWFTFLGSSLSFYHHDLGFACGSILITIFFVLCYIRYDKINPVVFGFLLFCILTGLAQAVVRSQVNMEFSYTTIRYKIMSILAFSGIFVALVECISTHHLRTLFLYAGFFISATLCICSYYVNSVNFAFRKQFLEDSLSRWHTVGAALEYQVPEQASRIMTESINNGIYRGLSSVKSIDISKVNQLPDTELKECGNMIVNLENINITDNYLFVRGWAFLFDDNNDDSSIHLVLKTNSNNASGNFAVTSLTRLRPDVTMHHKIHFNQGNLDHSGFQSLSLKSSFPPGEYSLGIVIKRGGSSYYKSTASKIKI